MGQMRNVAAAGRAGAGPLRIPAEFVSSSPLDREALLMLRIGDAKERLVEAWGRAVPVLAPSGHVTADEAREIGVGVAVYAAMAARCGKTPREALSHAEFLGLAPRLIEYWPVTDEGLAALEDLLRETQETLAIRAG